MTQTPKEAGYTYLYNSDRMYYFINDVTRQVECFAVKKDLPIATWGIKYRNTNLEFCSTWDGNFKQSFIQGLKRITRYGEQHPSFKTARRILIKLNEY